MNRKAVLIESSNVSGQTDLPGARADVANWDEFLRSDLGGAWTHSEICILRKPFSSDLDRELKVASDYYCFVAFSGHGCEGSIVLNEHFTSYPISALVPKCDRATLILDSCRGFEDAARAQFSLSTVRAREAAILENVAIEASHSARGWLIAKAHTEIPARQA